MVVLQTVSQVIPQVPPVWVPLSQITSVASTANVAVSLISQQSGTSAATQPQQQTDIQCKKCGKKNHSTMHCHKKVTCKQCKGKDHSTEFCTMLSQQELKCTFCGKSKHSIENFKARKKAKKKLKKELRAKRTSTVTSTATSTTSLGAPPLSQAQPPQSSASTSDPGDNAASTATNSWDRRKVTMLGQQSQLIDHVRIATPFSSTPCIYISAK